MKMKEVDRVITKDGMETLAPRKRRRNLFIESRRILKTKEKC